MRDGAEGGCGSSELTSLHCSEALHSQIRRMTHPLLSSSLSALAERLQIECLSGEEGLRWTSPLVSVDVDYRKAVMPATCMVSLSRRRKTSRALTDVSQDDRQRTDLITSLAPYTSVAEDGPDTSPARSETGIAAPVADPSAIEKSIVPITPPSITAATLAFFAWYPYHPNSLTTDITAPPHPTDIVCCRICERRVGLWAFRTDKRVFDLVDEHLVWCPIRGGGGQVWWEGCDLLSEKRGRGLGKRLKEEVRVSDRLERKSWRRV